MIINPQAEMLPVAMRQNIIFQRLHKNLTWAFAKSKFYREKFLKAQITPQDIKTLDDLANLPITTIEELQSNSLFDLLTMPLSATMRLDKTTNDLYLASTSEDIARNIDLAVRALATNDINKTSLLVLAGDYSSQSLLNLHYAAEALGATIIPCNDGKSALAAIDNLHANTLIITHTALNQILTINPNFNLPPKTILLTDKLLNPEITAIEAKFKQHLAKIYTSPEIGIPAILFTCEQNHWHIQDDYFYPEIVDDKLILTPLTFEAMPLLRLQTKEQITLVQDKFCTCGRTFSLIHCK